MGGQSFGGTLVPSIYFMSFCIMVSLVAVNLFIGVILENFEKGYEDEAKDYRLRSVYFWRDLWNDVDPTATGKITSEKMMEILACTPEPAGFLKQSVYDEILKQGYDTVTWNPLTREQRIYGLLNLVRERNCILSREEIRKRLEPLKLLVHKEDAEESENERE